MPGVVQDCRHQRLLAGRREIFDTHKALCVRKRRRVRVPMVVASRSGGEEAVGRVRALGRVDRRGDTAANDDGAASSKLDAASIVGDIVLPPYAPAEFVQQGRRAIVTASGLSMTSEQMEGPVRTWNT